MFLFVFISFPFYENVGCSKANGKGGVDVPQEILGLIFGRISVAELVLINKRCLSAVLDDDVQDQGAIIEILISRPVVVFTFIFYLFRAKFHFLRTEATNEVRSNDCMGRGLLFLLDWRR